MATEDVLFITLDSCRFDTFKNSYISSKLPNLLKIAPLHQAISPSYFTFGSHAAFWMGFTPGVVGTSDPWLNPKAGKLFRMAFAGSKGNDQHGFKLEGENIIEGFRRNGYRTIGTGAVDWFNPETETGSVLSKPFDNFYFPGNTWSLSSQLNWIDSELKTIKKDQPVFVFLNIGETHVPYWHEGANWAKWPSPCVPFGDENSSAFECRRRQTACLEWVDSSLAVLIDKFLSKTILLCGDHGDCWGEDGFWEHGISHYCTLNVPLQLRVRGVPIHKKNHNTNLFPKKRLNRFISLIRKFFKSC